MLNILMNLFRQLSAGHNNKSIGAFMPDKGESSLLLQTEHDEGQEVYKSFAAASVGYTN